MVLARPRTFSTVFGVPFAHPGAGSGRPVPASPTTVELAVCVGVRPEQAVELLLDLPTVASGPPEMFTFAIWLEPEDVWQPPELLIELSDPAAPTSIPCVPPTVACATSKCVLAPVDVADVSAASTERQTIVPVPVQSALRIPFWTAFSGPVFDWPGVASTPSTSVPRRSTIEVWAWYAPLEVCSLRPRPIAISPGLPPGEYVYGTFVLGVSWTLDTVPWPCGLVPYMAGVFGDPLPARGAAAEGDAEAPELGAGAAAGADAGVGAVAGATGCTIL